MRERSWTRSRTFPGEVTKATQSRLPGRFIDKFESLNTLLPHPGQFRSTADLLAGHAKAAIDASEFELAIQDGQLFPQTLEQLEEFGFKEANC